MMRKTMINHWIEQVAQGPAPMPRLKALARKIRRENRQKAQQFLPVDIHMILYMILYIYIWIEYEGKYSCHPIYPLVWFRCVQEHYDETHSDETLMRE